MSVALSYYPYRFVQNFYDTGDNKFLKYKQLYSFVSPRSHQTYWAWVEVYENNFYAIKFHLKEHRLSPHKYQLMTGYGEARPVINTCIQIMVDIARDDSQASFGFVGANMIGEPVENTKRFRVYRRFMATFFSDRQFEHLYYIEKSAYVMLRRTKLDANPSLVATLNQRFAEMYPYFE